MKAFGEVRNRYRFALVGYVVMPEHVPLLIGESKSGSPTTVVHSLKLRASKRMRRGVRKKSAATGERSQGLGMEQLLVVFGTGDTVGRD